jgi:hypothetical protein
MDVLCVEFVIESLQLMKSIERQSGFYKIINAEKQIIGGDDTGRYWIADTSRVLVSEDEYLEHLGMQH